VENGLLDMRYVSGLEKVQVGDMVFTTGQDGIYPAGYTIGQVVEVRPGSATQTQLIHIRPSAGLDRLKKWRCCNTVLPACRNRSVSPECGQEETVQKQRAAGNSRQDADSRRQARAENF
jgi:rod shape-determining protein MreC